jgi:hypothetical protein
MSKQSFRQDMEDCVGMDLHELRALLEVAEDLSHGDRDDDPTRLWAVITAAQRVAGAIGVKVYGS